MSPEKLEHIIEAMLFTAIEPLSAERLRQLLSTDFNLGTEFQIETITLNEIRTVLELIRQRYQDRGVQLVEVASGYRFQARLDLKDWLQKLHARKPMRYSKSFLETLALIAYRQPLTRGEIEDIRGVAVSTQTIKSLLDLEWIKAVGQRDVPGKPTLYATTKKFLDDFNLQSLNQLPTLKEPQNIDLLEAVIA